MKLLITILLFITYLPCSAQNYYSEQITSREGLPNNAIRSILKDSRGYMWIGTDAGVSSWDGKTFKTYNTLDGLAGNKVWCIDEDNNGNLWFACFGAGISKFDGQNFTSYTEKDGLVDNSVRIVKYSAVHNCLAIGTNKAISVLKDSIFYNFNTENGDLEKDVIITGFLEKDSCIEYYDFHSRNNKISFENKTPTINKDYQNNIKYGISSVFKSKNGDNYFGWAREGIIKLHNSGINEIPGIGQVFGITEDCLGDIWAASWNGGRAISPPGGLFVLEGDNANRLNSAYNITSFLGWATFFEINQNIIFYGTLDKGLYKIPPRYFEYYHPILFGENQLSVTDIEIDTDNNIWFITDSLLIFWNSNSYEKSKLSDFYNTRLKYEINSIPSNNIKSRIKTINEEYNKRNSHFFDMEFDINEKLWITINALGFFSITDKNIDKMQYHSTNVNRTFVFDNKNVLFMCNAWADGIRKYVNFKNSNDFFNYEDSLQPIYSKKLCNYKDEIWAFSKIKGVFMYKAGGLRTITTEDSTINRIVNDICFDGEGYAYLGGSNGQIEILTPETREKIFEISNDKHGISIQWIEISKNRLFVGFTDGLRVYKIEDIKNGKSNYQLFTESEGNSVQVVNSSVVDKPGNIWLATNNGLVKIVTNLFVDIKYEPLTTVIQKVELFNKDYDWKQNDNINTWSGLPLGTPKLNPDQNNISIYFNTLNYNNPKADNYYYKLKGTDKDWVRPSDKKFVIYPFLNPGEYTFIVKSKNELSSLYTEPAEFKFVILKHWYQQIWFYLLLTAFAITFFALFYNIIIKSMKKKEKSKREIIQKISELETKALQAQMNPHFLFNSINSIQSYILDNNVDEALAYLSSFSKIIRTTVEFVDKKFVNLSDCFEYLEHYVNLENMRFDDLFNYEVINDPEIDPESTLIPPMMLQTIVENSIKHGVRQLKHKGTIKLEIAKIDSNTYKCIIEDNGIGRVKSAQNNTDQHIRKESLGLKLIRERLNILNNGEDGPFKIEIIDLYSDNGIPTGTRVEITLALILYRIKPNKPSQTF